MKRLIGYIGMLLVAFTLPSVHAADDVKISINRSVQAVVAEIAEREGFYKEQGLSVKAFAEGSGAVSLQAVVGGSVNLAVGLHARIIQGLAKDLPLCVLGMVQYGLTSKILVPLSDKSSKTIADLKNKRLAVQVGSGTYVSFLILLDALGMKESDFVLKNMKTRGIPAAFESGSIDVAVAWEPYASIMVSKGLGRVVLDNYKWAETGAIVYPAFLYGNCDWIDNNKSTTQKFVNAWIKAIKFIGKEKLKTIDHMVTAYKEWGIKIPRDKVERGVYTQAYDKLAVDEASIKDSEQFASVMYRTKKIKKQPDIRKALRLEFQNKALATK
ncbi:ABC transporter substrate-binding protein [Pseudomonadota bacterium]